MDISNGIDRKRVHDYEFIIIRVNESSNDRWNFFPRARNISFARQGNKFKDKITFNCQLARVIARFHARTSCKKKIKNKKHSLVEIFMQD